MARTVAQIQTQITTYYVAAMAAIGITIDPTKWSRRNKQQLLINTFATATAIFEGLYDAFVVLMESIIARASPQTPLWFQYQMKRFQFDLTNPQVLQFDDTGDSPTFAPYYPVVDPDLQVIKYCSVVGGAYGTTTIKVAAQVGGFPADLEATYTGSLDSAQAYANLQGVSGITYNVITGNSDKIYIQANVYYQGGYSAVISDTVIAAIQAYLASIPFDGIVLLSDIELAIKAVTGVNDVVFSNVVARADSTAFGSGTYLVNSGTTISRKWSTQAGYIVGETTSGNTLADSLVFIPE